MIEYKYKGIDVEGKPIKNGVHFANDEADFLTHMEKQGIIITHYKATNEIDADAVNYKFKLKELSNFCREFGIMLSAGMQIIPALKTMEMRAEKPAKRQAFTYMVECLSKGISLPDTFMSMGKTFPAMLVSMIKAGTVSGSLDKVVNKMATYYDKEYRTKSKMQVAMIYPTLLVVVTLAVIILLFTFVLPQFFSIFEGMELPLITRIFMKISEFLVNKWYVLLIVCIVLTMGVIITLNIPRGKYEIDKLFCTIPVFGPLLMKGHTSRFTSAMHILLSSGLQIVPSLKISGEALANSYLEDKVRTVAENVEQGAAVSEQLEEQELFDSLVYSMLYTGEETGTTEYIYEKLSDFYEVEADFATQKIMAIMEPLILVVIGAIIGGVVAAVLIPMYQIAI